MGSIYINYMATSFYIMVVSSCLYFLRTTWAWRHRVTFMFSPSSPQPGLCRNEAGQYSERLRYRHRTHSRRHLRIP